MKKLAALLGLVFLLPFTLTVQLAEVDASPLPSISVSVAIDDVNAQATPVSASGSRSVSDTTRTPADPASTQTDDLYIAIAWIDVEDGSWTIATGWTQLDDVLQATGTGHANLSFIKRGASAPNLTWSYSGTAASIAVTVYAWRGQDLTTPFDVVYSNALHYQQLVDSPTGANPSIIMVNDNAVAFLVAVYEFSGSGTPGAPSGYVLDATGDNPGKPQHEMAHKTISPAATETPGVWTHTGFNAGEDPQQFTLAIREATTNVALLRRRGR